MSSTPSPDLNIGFGPGAWKQLGGATFCRDPPGGPKALRQAPNIKIGGTGGGAIGGNDGDEGAEPSCATSLRTADETARSLMWPIFEFVPSYRTVCYRQSGNVGTISVSLKMTVYTHARGLTLQRARGHERRGRGGGGGRRRRSPFSPFILHRRRQGSPRGPDELTSGPQWPLNDHSMTTNGHL